MKKIFLKISQNSHENTYESLSGRDLQLYLKTLAQVFSYKFSKNFKDIFFHRTPLMTASVYITIMYNTKIMIYLL